MARNLPSALRSHLEGNSFKVARLVKLGTQSSTKYFTDASFDIDYGGDTYTAQGSFLGITDSEEHSDVVVSKTNVILSAIEINNMETYAQSSMINQPIEINIVYLDPTNNTVIGEGILTFKGRVAGYTVNDARKTSTITLECANSFANFEKTNGRRTNEGSFQKEHPQDRSMEFSDQMFDLSWGKKDEG